MSEHHGHGQLPRHRSDPPHQSFDRNNQQSNVKNQDKKMRDPNNVVDPRSAANSGDPMSPRNGGIPRDSRSVNPSMVAPPQSLGNRYESITFGLRQSSDPKIQELFQYLQSLPPMDKLGSMSGDCDRETTQMEQFLKQNFGFKNISEDIVHGVRGFKLGKPLRSMDPNTIIQYPKNTATPGNSFAMGIDEICRWQSSYGVYADKNQSGMSKEFLLHALQGRSRSGEEAFRMKFVVRISQCPILMEFDGILIHRNKNEKWPDNIRLVSVTGIDFAGRIHDVDDIRTYLLNWEQIFEIDQRTGLPHVYNGRDFNLKKNAPRGKLDEDRLLRHLKRMAKLRLQACDAEKVQIVVETGIGLGVFAGKYIGIDDTVRTYSARAIREVLEDDGYNYQHIRAIVFALPIFDRDIRGGRREDTYQAFVDEFTRSNYKGRIPVLMADQDMHRLTVAIARKNYVVSELNPADSHGVFGEYWQNRGPAVEEKLALTTVGLLVQHHLINPYVLNPDHYHLV